jgi:hypothetical protein
MSIPLFKPIPPITENKKENAKMREKDAKMRERKKWKRYNVESGVSRTFAYLSRFFAFIICNYSVA